MDRERIKEAFDAYVAGYDLTDPKIRLKVVHTKHVAENCQKIARDIFGETLTICVDGIETNETAVDIAWLLGMLHDIGRFEQLRRYHTFIDADSIDHAAFGAELLFGGEHLIERFCDNKAVYPLLQEAIKNHSLYRLPEHLDPVRLAFCNIIRDADKVDIFRVSVEVPQEDIYSLEREDVAMSSISPEVLHIALEENTAVPSALLKTPADHVVAHICLFYELNYTISRRLTTEQGYLKRLLAFPFKNPETQNELGQLKKHITEWMVRAA